MAGTRRFIKAFLASPGDLAEERKVAKEIVDDFNSQLASALGYQVELVGWEDTGLKCVVTGPLCRLNRRFSKALT